MADSMFNEMSQNEKQQYMHASSSEVVIATVIFSVLMTLTVLNIVFYLVCKYVSRPRTSQNLDAKQVKRIKVKSASKDTEKESIKQLMNQLRSSSRRNSEVEIHDTVYDQDTSNINILKHSTNQEEFSVIIEPNNLLANIQRITLGNHGDEVCPEVKENVSGQEVQMETCIDDKNNLHEKVRNNVLNGGKSSPNNGDKPSTNNPYKGNDIKLKNINMKGDILEMNTRFTVDNTKNDIIHETMKIELSNTLSNATGYKNGDNSKEVGNDVGHEVYSDNGDIKLADNCPLIGNYGNQRDSSSSNEKDLLPEQNELPSIIISHLSQQTDVEDMNSLHDNHLKNKVAITITTVDGLQSAISFGSEMDITSK